MRPSKLAIGRPSETIASTRSGGKASPAGASIAATMRSPSAFHSREYSSAASEYSGETGVNDTGAAAAQSRAGSAAAAIVLRIMALG